ncbi:hypothetical protein RRG08_051610 [Elysia crispata]|uniref:Uncharacterized protein n=1 Tax=Elysia crispata TaxID=231223 RepID=A0AAE1A4F6_9GAST|nr:hypothetical protein RRG08_051610 [Elysia crispata]
MSADGGEKDNVTLSWHEISEGEVLLSPTEENLALTILRLSWCLYWYYAEKYLEVQVLELGFSVEALNFVIERVAAIRKSATEFCRVH